MWGVDIKVKILHTADLHLDSPFDALTQRQAAARRDEQRELLRSIAELSRREQADLVLLAGDILDSASAYHETQSVLARMFSELEAEVFIAPGNHDYYAPGSPYASLELPENVHIFKSPDIECIELPRLQCRVWGAGFTSVYSRPLLSGFRAPDSDKLEIMVMHGDMRGDAYNKITEQEIADSNLHYLALGHTHAFSGVKKAGRTSYAYPGCPEGRGFDETGAKGVITGTVSREGVDLRFVPLGGREYTILTADLTDAENARDVIDALLADKYARDIVRVVLTGEYDGRIDPDSLAERFADRAFALTVLDKTVPRRDIWLGAGEDTLRGAFLEIMRAQMEAPDELLRERAALAVRYGIAALDGAEEWRV